ncbi:MAG: two pore domain potassium channel family protein [Lysobacteraceae bacterium]|nr:MAG: two pore domain potassium channel family protein [Xanthomonadaceae bacterium]
MYQHWDANLLVVMATALSVGIAVLVHYEGLSLLSRGLSRRHESHRRRKVLYGIFGVLILHVAEIWIFGTAIWGLLHLEHTGSIAGAHPLGLFDAVYMSAVTFTTVGFGDLAPVGPIRFLAGTLALTGFVLITWSASFTYLEMTRDWRDH